MVAVYVEKEERDAFKTLCRTMGTDVSTVLRRFIQTAIQQQTVEFVVARSETSDGAAAPAMDMELIGSLMGRLAFLEQTMPKFDVDDLVRMKKEILDGEFGSMRYRVGVVEAQLQSLGGSIAWERADVSEV